MVPAVDITLGDAWQLPLSLSWNPVSMLQKTQAGVLGRRDSQRGPKDEMPCEGGPGWPA